MPYDFDEIIERRDTDSLKYDFAQKRNKPEGLLPMWVADMDFRAPPAVLEALAEKTRHGIFGYSEGRQDYFDALEGWFLRYFDWQVEPRWLIKTPGVVYALCAAIRALTRPGDAVLIQQPVYYPFAQSVLSNGRKLVVNQLVYAGGRYHIDFDDFEAKITENGVRLFLLCSPHNPVGRVWTREELTRMGDICLQYGVTVVSDDIHADFVWPGHYHSVFASLKPAYADITVTCTAPTKTFNLAGLHIANIFVSNDGLRRRLRQEVAASGYSQPNVMGLVACRAAYTAGHEWLAALKDYLWGNIVLLRDFLSRRIPEIRPVETEGTYLVWLDCRGLGLSDDQVDHLITHKAGLWLSAGTTFGAGGEGFQRINIACPRAILQKALDRLERAVHG